MKRKCTVSLILIIALLLTICATAQAAVTVTKGMLVTATAPYDFSVVIPQDMESVGSTKAFSYGYRSDSFLVGFTPMDVSSFDAFRESRMGQNYLDETELTVNGFAARLYTMAPDTNVMAVYAIQTGKDNNIMEIAFYPRDLSATAANQAYVDQILGSVRSRSQTFAADNAGENWSIMFNQNDSGLSTILPTSFVKRSKPNYDTSIVEYQNDYVALLIFGYDGTLDQYIEEYDMNTDEFYVTDTVVNGVNVHIFEPKSEQVSTDLAYIVAEGRNGSLLEFIFGATDRSEESENWMYINQIVANIAAM